MITVCCFVVERKVQAVFQDFGVDIGMAAIVSTSEGNQTGRWR
jgi:hypothetical protein